MVFFSNCAGRSARKISKYEAAAATSVPACSAKPAEHGATRSQRKTLGDRWRFTALLSNELFEGGRGSTGITADNSYNDSHKRSSPQDFHPVLQLWASTVGQVPCLSNSLSVSLYLTSRPYIHHEFGTRELWLPFTHRKEKHIKVDWKVFERHQKKYIIYIYIYIDLQLLKDNI